MSRWTVGRFGVGTPVEKSACDVHIVAARSPVQRCLARFAVSAAVVRVCSVLDQDPDNLGPVGQIAGPVRRDVQQCSALIAGHRRPGEVGGFGEDLGQRGDVAGTDRRDSVVGLRVSLICRDLLQRDHLATGELDQCRDRVICAEPGHAERRGIEAVHLDLR